MTLCFQITTTGSSTTKGSHSTSSSVQPASGSKAFATESIDDEETLRQLVSVLSNV